jgi:hypothetical protein
MVGNDPYVACEPGLMDAQISCGYSALNRQISLSIKASPTDPNKKPNAIRATLTWHGRSGRKETLSSSHTWVDPDRINHSLEVRDPQNGPFHGTWEVMILFDSGGLEPDRWCKTGTF